jgi:hypothetical protein
VGIALVLAAHAMGARHLAMEALPPDDAQAANPHPPAPTPPAATWPTRHGRAHPGRLALGWTLWPYEADLDQARPPWSSLAQRDTVLGDTDSSSATSAARR